MPPELPSILTSAALSRRADPAASADSSHKCRVGTATARMLVRSILPWRASAACLKPRCRRSERRFHPHGPFGAGPRDPRPALDHVCSTWGPPSFGRQGSTVHSRDPARRPCRVRSRYPGETQFDDLECRGPLYAGRLGHPYGSLRCCSLAGPARLLGDCWPLCRKGRGAPRQYAEPDASISSPLLFQTIGSPHTRAGSRRILPRLSRHARIVKRFHTENASGLSLN